MRTCKIEILLSLVIYNFCYHILNLIKSLEKAMGRFNKMKNLLNYLNIGGKK